VPHATRLKDREPPGVPFDVQPCLRDPVFRLIKHKWRLSPGAAGVMFLLLYFGGNFLSSWVSGTAFPRPGLDLSFLGDRTALVLYPFLVPVATMLAMRFYNQVESASERIYTEGVVEVPLGEYNEFLTQLHRRYNSLVLHVGALASAMLVFGYLTCHNQFNQELGWSDLGTGVGAIYHLFLGLIAWYSAILVLQKVVVTAWAIHRVFDWPVHIQPLHPDGCGGFRLLTDIAVTIALFAATMGMAAVLVVLADSILFGRPLSTARMMVVVVLQTLTPLAFLTCLYRAHRVMKAAKETMLREIHEVFEDSFAALRGRLSRREMTREATEEALGLESLHGIVRGLPVWPTNTQMLTQVLLSIALPLGLLLLQVVLEQVVWGGR
jgi:hypothetical protein